MAVYFNYAIILMFLLASGAWGWQGNWPQAGYWLAAALLNICVTVGMK